MLKNRVTAALLCAVFAVPASGAEGLPDFDQGVDVARVVADGRTAAQKTEDVAGESLGSSFRMVPIGASDVSRRIVVFHKGTSRARRIAIVTGAGGNVTSDLWLINGVGMTSANKSIQSVEAALASAPEVLRVEEDKVQNWLKETPKGCPPEWPPEWPCPFPPDDGGDGGGGQSVPWGIQRVNAPQAWPSNRGAGVKLAVVDTGIDAGHSDLQVLGGFNSTGESDSYNDDHGHGTHVSGTISAEDNGKGVIGVAPDVDLYGVKVLNSKGEGTYETVIGGLQWTVERKMQVVNMSLGGDETTQAMEDAFRAAADAGVTVVAAAGNSGRAVGYPAAYDSTIAVAASSEGDKVAYFSSRGPQVDVIAPGVGVNSTYKGGGYKKLDGTSMACPHVAGLAALAVSAKGISGIDAIRAALKGAATPFPGVPATQQGAGMIDAAKLVSGSGI